MRMHLPDNQPRSIDRPGERGQALVEFAMVVPILLTIVFAAMEFGQAFWHYQQLSAAASEGARKAIVSRNDPDRENTIITQTHNAAPGLKSADMKVEVTSTWTPGDNVTVTARYPEDITVMGIHFYDDDLVSTRTMRVEQ
jgi:Flp pilus assembly protein TadG